MAVDGEQSSSFLEYTQAWISSINRGGLFELNDASFLLFIVQVLWSTLSLDVTEEYVQELLQDVVDMWVTIRGFSMTSFWIEQYKVCIREA